MHSDSALNIFYFTECTFGSDKDAAVGRFLLACTFCPRYSILTRENLSGSDQESDCISSFAPFVVDQSKFLVFTVSWRTTDSGQIFPPSARPSLGHYVALHPFKRLPVRTFVDPCSCAPIARLPKLNILRV